MPTNLENSAVATVLEKVTFHSNPKERQYQRMLKLPHNWRIAESLQSWDRRVRPRLVWRNGTPLDSRVVHGVTGHLSICMWNLHIFSKISFIKWKKIKLN